MKIQENILIFLLFLSAQLYGRTTIQWANFDIETTLPTNNIYNSLIDQNGFLWLATTDGVLRYNGYFFERFTTEQGLPSNDIYEIIEDNKGRIWTYSLTPDFGYIHNNKFTALPLKNAWGPIYPSSIYQYGDRVFFMYSNYKTRDYQLVFHDKDATIEYTLKRNKPFRHISINTEGDVCAYDSLSNIYYWSFRNSIHLFSALQRPMCLPQKNLYHELIRSPYTEIANNNILWFAKHKTDRINYVDIRHCKTDSLLLTDLPGQNGYIYLFTKSQRSLTVITDTQLHFLDQDMKIVKSEAFRNVTDAQVTYRTETQGGIVFYSTIGAGLWQKTSEYLPQNDSVLFSLLAKSKLVGQHEMSHYWWNSNRNQLVIFSGDTIMSILHNPYIGDIRKILQLNTWNLLVVTSTALFKLDLKQNYFSPFYTSFRNTVSYNWTFFTQLSNQREVVPDSLRSVLTQGVFDLHITSAKTMHAATQKGLVTYRESESEPRDLHILLTEMGRMTNALFDRTHNALWVFNKNGDLSLFRIRDSTTLSFTTEALQLFGLKNWQDIQIDHYGNLYFLQSENIIVVNPYSKLFYVLEHSIQLLGSKLIINDSTIFIAGKFGVAVYDIINSRKFKKTTHWLNVKQRLYKQVLSFGYIDTSLWILSDKGLYKISPRLLKAHAENNTLYNSLLTTVIRDPVSFKITDGCKIKLPRETDRILLSFTNFLGSGIPVIEYSINQNNKWHRSYSGEILLHKLSAEKWYQLKFRIIDDNTITNTTIFSIYIQPFWWQKKIFKITIFFSTLLSLSILGYLLFRYIRSREIRVNEKRRLQTELELRAIHSQINPHFIFNTLSTALYFISMQKTNQAYNHVNQFSKLLRNYLKSSRERFITLTDEIEILKQYIELQRVRFSSGFYYEINVDENVDTHHILLPSLLLQPLVENAINHGLFNKGNNGILRISFSKGTSPTELICIIDDNGIGRTQAKTLNKRYREEKKSYGTLLTKELIDTFKRYEQMDIILEYTDKVFPQTGTSVKLNIKNIKIKNTI